jgi:DNA repair exonuclease SbcCD ATPase subunit
LSPKQACRAAEDARRWAEADDAVLASAALPHLNELVAALEERLARARAAQLAAAAADATCPVCWERRKGMVFQCGGW